MKLVDAKTPVKIAFLYFVIGISWIFLSDFLLQSYFFLIFSPELLQTAKGILFVTITSLLLFSAMKKQQEILLNSENHYKSLFYSNSNPFWIYDLDTLKFLEVNHATIQIYGYSREEFKHMTILNICTESDQKRIIETARTLKDYRISGNWKHIKKNGKEFNVSVTSHRIKYEHHNCAVVMAHDMTTRLNYEEKLKLAYGTEKN